MKCTVEQNQLTQTLTEASRFVSSKALNPVLSGIYISADDGKLEVRASSGQSLYTTTLPCTTELEGFVVVPAQLFLSAVKSLDKGEMSLELQPESLLVSQGSVQFSVAFLTATDFPNLVTEGEAVSFLLPTTPFTEACEKVLVAASRDESKPVLTSVLLEMSQPNAVVTSDGFRLYRVQVDLSLDKPEKMLLPARLLREILAIVAKSENTVVNCEWYKSLGQVVFSAGVTKVQLSVVNGDFPPYKAIIPEATSFAITVDRDLLKQRLQQIMVLAKELSNIVVFSLEDGQLSVSSQASVRGQSAAKIAVSQVQGEVAQFACNGVYVLDFLSSVDVPEIVIQGTDPLKPVLLGVPGSSAELYLIMPFKLQK